MNRDEVINVLSSHRPVPEASVGFGPVVRAEDARLLGKIIEKPAHLLPAGDLQVGRA